MKSTDKFLVGMVAIILLLLVVIFMVVLRRSPAVYQPEDLPQGVVYNYLLALENGDYERAMNYISKCIQKRPSTVWGFTNLTKSWEFDDLRNDTSLNVESVKETHDGVVVLVNQTTFRNFGLLDSRVSHDAFTMLLVNQGGEWKLVGGDKYWLKDWQRAPDCP